MMMTYENGFTPSIPMAQKVDALKSVIMKMPQYEPLTKHHFHAGMYCREVWRDADVLVVGKVHKKEHFYFIVYGTVTITTDDGVQSITGPHLLKSKPGSRRAVYSETPALCMTFHVTDSKTVEEAETELVEEEPSMYDSNNLIKNETKEVML